MGYEYKIALKQSIKPVKAVFIDKIATIDLLQKIEVVESTVTAWLHEQVMEDVEIEVKDKIICVCFYGGSKTQRDSILTVLIDNLKNLEIDYSVEET